MNRTHVQQERHGRRVHREVRDGVARQVAVQEASEVRHGRWHTARHTRPRNLQAPEA
jgi:hypothetical protein